MICCCGYITFTSLLACVVCDTVTRGQMHVCALYSERHGGLARATVVVLKSVTPMRDTVQLRDYSVICPALWPLLAARGARGFVARPS